MKFNEKQANEIIAKYNLSKKTLRVWRNRGSVPDKYFKINYTQPTPTTKGQKVKQALLMNLLKSGAINLTVLADSAGVKHSRVIDAKREVASLSIDDYTALKTELKRLKLLIAKTFEVYSENSLKKLLKNKTLHYSVIVKDRLQISRIEQVRKRGRTPDIEMYNDLKDKYIVFAITMNI